MSETEFPSPPAEQTSAVPAASARPSEFDFGPPVPYAVFAAGLKPRSVPLVRNGQAVVQNGRQLMTAAPGHPDEVWLKLLKIRHGGEKHTVQGWNALIDAMRDEPAHPSDPRFVA